MHDYSEIQTAFLNGVEEIFTELLTSDIQLFLFDKNTVHSDIYGDKINFEYIEPIKLVGSFKETEQSLNEKNQLIDMNVATVRIPTKQLITNEISHENQEDIDYLCKSKISWKGHEYLVSSIQPKAFVGDMYQIYEFSLYRQVGD